MKVALFLFLTVVAAQRGPTQETQDETTRPNIVVFLADDMGFSDIRSFGGEIETPHLDRLAREGVRFRQFCNTARCCPSRASLLTGVYAHRVGMGWMTAADLGHPGYTGVLAADTITIPEALRNGGYATAMVGKWHLSFADRLDDGPDETWPLSRGFERFYGTMEGAKNYFKPKWLYDGKRHVENVPDGYFFTRAISQRAAEYVRATPTDKPLFLYVAFYAPHAPWQAPEATIAKYAKRYLEGWDELRAQRLRTQIDSGVVSETTKLAPRHRRVPAWKDLTPAKQKKAARAMATYAAMVDELDQGVGRVMQALEQTGRAKNTLTMFLSDNGAWPGNSSIQRGWGQVSNTPFRSYKKQTHEGGIRSPLIVHWPKGLAAKGAVRGDPCHIVDLFATCVEAAGVTPPTRRNGKPVKRHQGRSLLGAARGKSTSKPRAFGFEHNGNRAWRRYPHKLVARGAEGPWEVYDLSADPTELADLSTQRPQLRDELVSAWNAWAESHGVLPLDGRSWNAKIRFSRERLQSKGANLARGAKTRASSLHAGRYSANKAVDGVVSDDSRWVSTKAARSWLEIDLGRQRAIASAHVYTGWKKQSQNRAFHFEAERDGKFVAVPGSRVRSNKRQFVAVRFRSAVETSKIRLVVTDGDRARIREVALWSRADVAQGTGVETKTPKGTIRPSFARDVHVVAVNQIGYDTHAAKRFTCPQSPDGSTFHVLRVRDGEKLMSGTVRGGRGDFTALRPADSTNEYVVEVSGGNRMTGRSDPFRLHSRLLRDQHWQTAIDFMVDCRSVTGTHPSAFGGCPWRDATYYSFEVPSLVMMHVADEAFVRAMPRQIDWAKDKARVLADGFRFDAKNPSSGKVMETTRRYYTELAPPKPDAPDTVKLIHWGLGYYLFDPETKDPSNDPLPNQIHSQTVEQFAFFLHAWPKLRAWLDQDFHDRCLAFVEVHWERSGSFGIDPLWHPKTWLAPVKSGDDYSIGKKLHPYKGRHCSGHSILPNLLMHEVATRLRRPNAKRYLDAAVAQAAWVVKTIDWRDPRATKGHRGSEHKLPTGLVWLLRNHPDRAPRGLRQKLEAWARSVVAHSENMWDFRRYDLKTHWTIPKLNETGNLAGFPAAAAAVALVLEDDTLKTRLLQISQAHIDNLFGRNPMLAAAPHLPKMGFPLVERGWPKGHRNNVCARLELVRGALSASPGSEMYPFDPNGSFRHAEGWCAWNAAWNVSLAFLRTTRDGKLPFEDQ